MFYEQAGFPCPSGAKAPNKKDAPHKAVRLVNLSSANLLLYQPFREPTIMPLVKYFRMKG